MQHSEIRIYLKSSVKFIEFVLLCLSYLNNNHFHFEEEDFFKIELSLREALNNAIHHGNRDCFEKEVQIVIRWDLTGLEITVTDQSEEVIDFTKIEADNRNKDLLSFNGRGIMIMRSYMDELLLCSTGSGNSIVMKKSFNDHSRN